MLFGVLRKLTLVAQCLYPVAGYHPARFPPHRQPGDDSAPSPPMERFFFFFISPHGCDIWSYAKSVRRLPWPLTSNISQTLLIFGIIQTLLILGIGGSMWYSTCYRMRHSWLTKFGVLCLNQLALYSCTGILIANNAVINSCHKLCLVYYC